MRDDGFLGSLWILRWHVEQKSDAINSALQSAPQQVQGNMSKSARCLRENWQTFRIQTQRVFEAVLNTCAAESMIDIEAAQTGKVVSA